MAASKTSALQIGSQIAVGLAGLALGYHTFFRDPPVVEDSKENPAAFAKAAAAGTAAVAPGAGVALPKQPSIVDQLDEETKHTSGRCWK